MKQSSYYGKRPVWQWIVIYLIFGAILYGAAYYLYSMRKGGYTYSMPSQPSASALPSASTQASIVSVKTDAVKGGYLVAANGMTLYVFDKDAAGVSNCSGGCAKVWPPYVADGTAASLPSNVTTIKRADGTLMYAYQGHPLYFYAKDQKVGDLTGDGVNGTWHLVKPQ